MRRYFIAALLALSVPAMAQQPRSGSTLRTVLLQELRETHNEKNWFVSEKEAVAGLTPEQAAWSDGRNHSVGQLVEHLNLLEWREHGKVQEPERTENCQQR